MKIKDVSTIAKDSIMLTIVRVVTLVASIVQTMVLSRIMSLFEYGTLSSITTIISISVTISGLGLSNAVNYFYNKEDDYRVQNGYMLVIFLLTIIFGILAALLLYLFSGSITSYYKNEMLKPLFIYIIFRPLFSNIIYLYPPLYISRGKAKTIAYRNFAVSLIQAIFVPLSFFLTHNLKVLLLVQAFLDILQIAFFSFNIKIFSLRKTDLIIAKDNFHNYCKKVFLYCIPLGISVAFGTLLKECDKLVIGRFMDSEHLALYTNMSKQLPFEFIVLSFTAVIIPVITKCWKDQKINSIKNIWSNYIMFGLITTWILCFGAIVVSPELLQFLYSEKYLPGIKVFIIYLLVDMLRFCNFNVILSATGKTKLIMISSIVSLCFNIIFNIFLYKTIGFIGPAISSLVTVLIINSLLIFFSCKILKTRVIDLFSVKTIIKASLCIFITGITFYYLKKMLSTFIYNYLLLLVIIYVLFLIVNYFVLRNDIIYSLKEMKEGNE